MVKKKTKMRVKQWMFWIGASVVAGTHIGIITMGLPQELILQHASINLGAFVLIVAQRFIK